MRRGRDLPFGASCQEKDQFMHHSGVDLGRQSRKITLSREMAFLAEQRTYLNISVHLLVSKLTVI